MFFTDSPGQEPVINPRIHRQVDVDVFTAVYDCLRSNDRGVSEVFCDFVFDQVGNPMPHTYNFGVAIFRFRFALFPPAVRVTVLPQGSTEG